MTGQELSPEIHDALRRMLGRSPDSVRRLPGGANNVVLEVRLGAARYCAKVYFRHPRDPRDRLGAEFGMLSFLWRHGVRDIPQPLQADRDARIGLYEFVDGRRPTSGEIRARDVRQLTDLLIRMWRLRTEPEAEALPAGSDACFSLRQFVENIGGRFRYMCQVLDHGGPIEEAGDYIRRDLTRTYADILRALETGAKEFGLDMERRLDRIRQTLNPADHGFHNTLRESNGKLRFLDFEYSGWDDPAQMISNALWQPAVPMPARYRRDFLRRMLLALGDPELALRLRLLHPLLGFKWCLIMLNEFLPVSQERRRFAGEQPESRRQQQLQKSRRYLTRVRRWLSRPLSV